MNTGAPADFAIVGENLVGGYGGGDILKGCTVGVARGEIAVIVGPNGAGKSTAMRALVGMLQLRRGRVWLHGRDITQLPPPARIARGVGFVPQTANVFAHMTVRENLEMGAYLRTGKAAATGAQAAAESVDESLQKIFQLFPALAAKQQQAAGELSGGQRQQVAAARALMGRPTVLLLDEPTAGVAPRVMDELFARIVAIRDTGLAVLLVEQNARQALEIADRGYVLVMGENRHSDRGAALLANPKVRKSFLGG